MASRSRSRSRARSRSRSRHARDAVTSSAPKVTSSTLKVTSSATRVSSSALKGTSSRLKVTSSAPKVSSSALKGTSSALKVTSHDRRVTSSSPLCGPCLAHGVPRPPHANCAPSRCAGCGFCSAGRPYARLRRRHGVRRLCSVALLDLDFVLAPALPASADRISDVADVPAALAVAPCKPQPAPPVPTAVRPCSVKLTRLSLDDIRTATTARPECGDPKKHRSTVRAVDTAPVDRHAGSKKHRSAVRAVDTVLVDRHAGSKKHHSTVRAVEEAARPRCDRLAANATSASKEQSSASATQASTAVGTGCGSPIPDRVLAADLAAPSATKRRAAALEDAAAVPAKRQELAADVRVLDTARVPPALSPWWSVASSPSRTKPVHRVAPLPAVRSRSPDCSPAPGSKPSSHDDDILTPPDLEPVDMELCCSSPLRSTPKASSVNDDDVHAPPDLEPVDMELCCSSPLRADDDSFTFDGFDAFSRGLDDSEAQLLLLGRDDGGSSPMEQVAESAVEKALAMLASPTRPQQAVTPAPRTPPDASVAVKPGSASKEPAVTGTPAAPATPSVTIRAAPSAAAPATPSATGPAIPSATPSPTSLATPSATGLATSSAAAPATSSATAVFSSSATAAATPAVTAPAAPSAAAPATSSTSPPATPSATGPVTPLPIVVPTTITTAVPTSTATAQSTPTAAALPTTTATAPASERVASPPATPAATLSNLAPTVSAAKKSRGTQVEAATTPRQRFGASLGPLRLRSRDRREPPGMSWPIVPRLASAEPAGRRVLWRTRSSDEPGMSVYQVYRTKGAAVSEDPQRGSQPPKTRAAVYTYRDSRPDPVCGRCSRHHAGLADIYWRHAPEWCPLRHCGCVDCSAEPAPPLPESAVQAPEHSVSSAERCHLTEHIADLRSPEPAVDLDTLEEDDATADLHSPDGGAAWEVDDDEDGDGSMVTYMCPDDDMATVDDDDIEILDEVVCLREVRVDGRGGDVSDIIRRLRSGGITVVDGIKREPLEEDDDDITIVEEVVILKEVRVAGGVGGRPDTMLPMMTGVTVKQEPVDDEDVCIVDEVSCRHAAVKADPAEQVAAVSAPAGPAASQRPETATPAAKTPTRVQRVVFQRRYSVSSASASSLKLVLRRDWTLAPSPTSPSPRKAA